MDTTKSTSGRGIVEFSASQISGGALANIVSNGNAFVWKVRRAAGTFTSMILDEDSDLWLDAAGKGITLTSGTSGGADSAAVADEVSLGQYEIGVGQRSLAISQENPVVADTDETKFSNKLPVRINGTTYNIMLTVS